MAKSTGTGNKSATKDSLPSKAKDAPIVKMGQTVGKRHGFDPSSKVKGKG